MTANVRVPDLTIGDFNAQFAANAIGVMRVKQLCERYGAGKVEAAMAEMQDYSERRVRAAIAQAPKGTFYGEDAVDDDGLTDDPLVVKAKVTIAEDLVEIDFEGTCAQVKRNLNCPYSSTLSAALSCVKSVLTSPDIPYNEGMARPIRIKVPYGSLLNPRPPAPVRARMIPAYRVFNAVMKAMAQALPDKVIATGFDCTTAFCLSHLGEKGYSVYLEIFGGGYGASKERRRLRRRRFAAQQLLQRAGRIARHRLRLLPHRRLRAGARLLRPGRAARRRGLHPPLRDPARRRAARDLLRPLPARARGPAGRRARPARLLPRPSRQRHGRGAARARPPSTSPRATSSKCSWAAARASAASAERPDAMIERDLADGLLTRDPRAARKLAAE